MACGAIPPHVTASRTPVQGAGFDGGRKRILPPVGASVGNAPEHVLTRCRRDHALSLRTYRRCAGGGSPSDCSQRAQLRRQRIGRDGPRHRRDVTEERPTVHHVLNSSRSQTPKLTTMLRPAQLVGPAWRRVPLRAVRLFPEVGAGDEFLPEVLRIVDDCRNRDPCRIARTRMQVEVLREHGVLAIGNAVLAQVTRPECLVTTRSEPQRGADPPPPCTASHPAVEFPCHPRSPVAAGSLLPKCSSRV